MKLFKKPTSKEASLYAEAPVWETRSIVYASLKR